MSFVFVDSLNKSQLSFEPLCLEVDRHPSVHLHTRFCTKQSKLDLKEVISFVVRRYSMSFRVGLHKSEERVIGIGDSVPWVGSHVIAAMPFFLFRHHTRRNKHIVIDLGTSNNKKIDWPIKEKQGIIMYHLKITEPSITTNHCVVICCVF